MVEQVGSHLLGFACPAGLAYLEADKTGAVLKVKSELALVTVAGQGGVSRVLPLQQIEEGPV